VREFIFGASVLPFRNVLLSDAASLAVSQILDCRLAGSFRHTFLCAKTLELLCHVLLAFGSGVPGVGNATLAEHYLRKIRHARRLIEQSLDAPLNIPDLAAAVGTTRQRLQLGFRQIYGGTVAQIRDKLRIEHALHLVRHSQIPMTDIAMEAGYEHLGSFTRAFRATYGTSPSQMRRMAKA
jgi:AraC-like DNA-binding protein